MKKNYQVFQIYKVHDMLSFTNKYNHNTRKHIYNKDGKVLNPESELLEFYHPENNVHNKYEFLDDDSLSKAWKLSIKGRDIKRKVQKNASPGFEFVISASEDWNKDWKTNPKSKELWENYFENATKWMEEKYGADIILNKTQHWDETTPHMHFLVTAIVPLSEKELKNPKNEGRKWKFSSSEFLGGRDGMRKLHTEFWDEVGKNFGLDRGEVNSRAKHSDLKKYKKAMEEELDRQKCRSEKLERQIKWYDERENQLISLNEKQVDLFHREASRRFNEEIKRPWNTEDDVPKTLPATAENESAEQYRSRIEPKAMAFFDKCRNLISKNRKMKRVLTQSFSTKIRISGNRSDTCRFKFGLVDAFKKLCDRLCYISGISPKELGATPIVESDFTKDWFEDDLREWESPSDEWEYER